MTDIDQLYRSLGERRRPDDVADWIEHVLARELTRDEARVLATAAWSAQRRRLKTRLSMPVADVEARLRERIAALAAEVGVTPGHCDFLTDRLDRVLRQDAPIFVSKRRYNRMFRWLRRLEAKLAALPRQRAQADVVQVGQSRLATKIGHARFVQSLASACFIAYFVARASRRGEFTIDGQELPLDDVAAMLLARCARAPDTSWFAIAHVHPTTAVLVRLDDARKLELFGVWGSMMHRLADLMAEEWTTMATRRRKDSTRWNQLARAWNQVRAGWMAMAHAIGAADLLDRACPGKAMRMVGGKFEDWHCSVGGDREPDTQVWAELPMPWLVVRGEAVCGRAEIERACARAGVDPVASGWTASS